MNPRQIRNYYRKPNLIKRINNWVESHWATPAFSGWIILGIALAFFGAATNTMAGWLYVLSGINNLYPTGNLSSEW